MKRGAAIVLFLTLFAATGQAQSIAPIMLRQQKVGGAVYVDGVTGWAKVQGLKAGGDGFLAVRDCPQATCAERDRLSNGRFVFSIVRRGEWRGVIYTVARNADFDRDAQECGLDENAARKLTKSQAYTGPCKWGWVNSRWVVDLTD